MARLKKKPENQLQQKFQGQVAPTYDEITNSMLSEVTSIATDYMRQYIGMYGLSYNGKRPPEGTSIYINQDPILQQQIYNQWVQYDLYWYVEQDTTIRSILKAAKVNVVSMPWKVKPYLRQGEKKPSVTNQAMADFVQRCFDQMENFPQHCFDLMDSLGKGFSFSELMWRLTNDNYWTIDYLLNRTQRRIQFDAQTRQPRVRTVENPWWGDIVPSGKYIVHRVSGTWENPFGDALDQSLYWMWLFKKQCLQFYLKHAEVVASSIPIIKYDQGSKGLKDQLYNMAANIRNGAYGVIPQACELVWGETKNSVSGAEVYDKFIHLMNSEMEKCVKGQTLTTDAGAGKTGTRAQAQVHMLTENQFDMYHAKGLAASINKYMVRHLIDYNFSNVEGYPRYAYEIEESVDLKAESEVVKNIATAFPGYEFDMGEINEKFGYTLTRKEANNIQQSTPLSNKEVNENGNLIETNLENQQ